MNWLVHLRRLTPLLSVLLFAAAGWALHDALQDQDFFDIVGQLETLTWGQFAAAIAFTVVSYLMLTGYEALAMQHVGCRLPYPKIALGSFIGYVFAHNVGFSLISGGSVRYRIYSAEGVASVDIALITLLCTINFGLGATLLVGLALLVEPASMLSSLDVPIALLRAFGIVCLLSIFAYLAWTSLRRRPIRLRDWEIRPPSLGFSLAQIGVSVLDIGAAAGALYVLSPLPQSGAGFIAFVGVFTLAIVAGVISHVPGGLGVVETVVILLLPDQTPGDLLAALIAYRVIYYVIPLLIGGLLLAAFEASAHFDRLQQLTTAVSAMADRIIPPIMGLLMLVAGTVLLVSGATPAVGDRLDLLSQVLPLQVVEGSHLLASLTGLLLLVLARGLVRRLDAAYHLAVGLLAAGIVFSLLKGLDYEEAILLACILAALLMGRRAFYRRASLLAARFNSAWIATLAVLIGGSLWLGFFSFKEVEYSHDLWWEFAFDADAPRFLRATFVVCVAAVVIAAYRMLRPARPELREPEAADMQRVASIVEHAASTEANLAFLGDKRFLFSGSGNAFIMYAVEGRSWIALGDPVGDRSEWSDVLWRFREICDRHGGRTVLYEVSTEALPLCVDLGLSVFKIGEEGRIRLTDFGLDGGARKDLRYAYRRAQKDGLRFEMHPKEAVAGLLPELRRVSDAWLGDRDEKGFSLGAFIPRYLKHFPCALVRQNGRIVAFATAWCGTDQDECSVDLMRYLPDASKGVMDYLFIEMMLWGHQEGYAWFSLGMAPLSGLAHHTLAPLWNRIGTLIFRNSDHFYNFEGLRRYKEKFRPEWRPKYLACPGGLAVAPALIDVTSLVGRRPEA